MVAIDERHAEERQWPESMRLPTDGTKRVYLLEAYHLLHCLVCTQLATLKDTCSAIVSLFGYIMEC